MKLETKYNKDNIFGRLQNKLRVYMVEHSKLHTTKNK